jgi:hypothetical protein
MRKKMVQEAESDACRSACGSETRSDGRVSASARTLATGKIANYLYFFFAKRDLCNDF